MKTTKRTERIRLLAIIFVSLFVISTGSMFAAQSFRNGDTVGGILGVGIAVTILAFAVKVYHRGYEDIKGGYPLQDERSKKVLQKASSTAFYISLYGLLAIGFLSDNLIPFRDVSQATGIAVGLMALLFAIFWIYYNKREM